MLLVYVVFFWAGFNEPGYLYLSQNLATQLLRVSWVTTRDVRETVVAVTDKLSIAAVSCGQPLTPPRPHGYCGEIAQEWKWQTGLTQSKS